MNMVSFEKLQSILRGRTALQSILADSGVPVALVSEGCVHDGLWGLAGAAVMGRDGLVYSDTWRGPDGNLPIHVMFGPDDIRRMVPDHAVGDGVWAYREFRQLRLVANA